MSRLAYLSGALRVSTDPSAVMGGPRSHVLGMIGGFRAAGWEVETYIAGDRGWARRFAGGDGAEETVRAAPWRAAITDGLRIGAAAWNGFAAKRALAHPPDLVYERFASYQRLGRRIRGEGRPWVLETSGPFFHEAKVERGTLAFDGLARRRELGAYRSCDLLVCVSDPLREFLANEGVPSDHMFVLPNGVDVERFAPRTEPVREPGPFRVGFVGTVQSWQGLELLVDATAELRSRGADLQVEVVGAGSGLAAVRDKAEALGLSSAVTLAGQVPATEVPGRIAGFDVGYAGHIPLLAGDMYHSPLKLYEYMAMGKPVVASRYPDATSLVERSGVGYLFEPGDVGSLVAVLEKAMHEREAVRSSASTVSSFIRANESWDRRVLDLLDELARRSLL